MIEGEGYFIVLWINAVRVVYMKRGFEVFLMVIY